MNNNKIILSLLLLLFISPAFAQQTPDAKAPAKTPAQTVQNADRIRTTPLDVVANPDKFLSKKIIMDGKFDKFTTLGLDYKKAFRDSSKYIGFLLQRDDVKDHNVPLSEMKLFLKRDYAEKFVDLNTGDKISVTGIVFSNALGDSWVEVDNITVLEKAPKEKEE